MTTNFGTGSTITNVFQPNQNPVDPAKQGLLFGSRTLNSNNQLILPSNGNAMPSPYIPIQLPAFTDPVEALVYLGTLGFNYTQGITFTATYPAPDDVKVDNNTGLTTLIWNSPAVGLQDLVSGTPNGSVTQVNSGITSTGTIRSLDITATQTFLSIVPVSVSSFTTQNDITVDALISSQAPDPTTSDEICIGVYWFYAQYATAAKFTSSPNLWISVTIEGRDPSISPVATPITLVAPTSVTEPGDGSQNLVYPLTANNLGLLPTEYFGTTSVTQDVSLLATAVNNITYVNGLFLLGNGSSGISYSTNGLTYTPSALTSGTFLSFAYGADVYVAVSTVGIYYSADGDTWTLSGETTGNFVNVIFANNMFIACSDAGLFYSTDGDTWTQCTDDDSADFKKIAYGNGVWVAVTTDADAYASSDGITFAALSVPDNDGFYTVVFANDVFILGGNNGTGIYYSTDGETFVNSIDGFNVTSITYNTYLSRWLAATSVGIYYSDDNVNWTQSQQTTGIWYGVTFDSAINVAISNTLGIAYSADGNTWVQGSDVNYANGVIYGNNAFLAFGGSGMSASGDGITWISGSSSISGVYNGYTLTANTCVINVVNVSVGEFNTASSISVVLDSSLNGGKLTGEAEISSFAMVKNVRNLNVLTTTYADFYNLILGFQDPQEAANNKFNVQGYYGYSPATINQYPLATLTTPNVTYFKASARLDIPTAFQYPNIPAVHVMETMFQNLNNETPYYDTSGTASILNMTASTNKSTLPSDFALNQLTSQGWTAVGALSTGQMYVWRDVCTLQTISGKEDTEFRYEPLQLKTRWLDKNVTLVAEATVILPNGMRKNNNPETIAELQSNIEQVLLVGYNAGMLGNTENNVTVTVNPNDPSRLIISVTTTIVPTNSGSDITVYVKSYAVQTAA